MSSAKIYLMTGDEALKARTMMLGFRARNVRSFRDQFEFSLEATAMSEPEVPRAVPWREEGHHPLRVLPAAGVFGANASGKSNFLRVLDDMRSLVLKSFSAGARSTRLRHRPFRLDPDCERGPSRYEIDLVLDGIRFEYGFTISDEVVISEYARSYPRGKAVNIFRRDGFELYPGDRYRAKSRAVGEILRPNALYLSAAGAADHPGLQPLYDWFEQNLWLCEADSRERRWAYTTQLLAHDEYREKILAMLLAADLGIVGARPREPDPETRKRIIRLVELLQQEMDPDASDADITQGDGFNPASFLRVALSHRGSSGSVELDTRDESLGTLVWFGLIGPILDALRRGTVLLVDELESSLHPALVAQIVRTFQSPQLNPNGSQIIFNSFEASLLGNSVDDRVLGRDQVWFTEKLNDGSTRLYPLTDLGPRKTEAVTRRYLSGRYGATPIISEAEFDSLAATMSPETDK